MVERPALELAGWAVFGAPVSVGAFQCPPCQAGDAGMITAIMWFSFGISLVGSQSWQKVETVERQFAGFFWAVAEGSSGFHIQNSFDCSAQLTGRSTPRTR